MRQQQMQGPPIGDDGKPMVAIHEGNSAGSGSNRIYGGTTRWITQTEYDRTIGKRRRIGQIIGRILLGIIAIPFLAYGAIAAADFMGVDVLPVLKAISELTGTPMVE